MSQLERKKLNNCEICNSNLKDISMGSFSYCPYCGLCYNNKHFLPDYTDTYFTVDYRKQYGKTYEEDMGVITDFAKKRLSRIKRFIKKPESLLEIGCALGFFMKQSISEGFIIVKGIEISEYAASFARSHFDFNIFNDSFSKYSDDNCYDVVGAWYVLEHDPECLSSIKKAASFVKNNGVLAISLPSTWGPLFRYDFNKWVQTHPSDHSMDFSPKSIKKYLKHLGFSKIKVYPASVHPERVFNSRSFLFRIKAFFYKIFCNITAFSDTIEIYAKK